VLNKVEFRPQINTYAVPWLLGKDLRKSDHLVAFELLAQIDEAIGSILLLARSGSSEEGGEGSNRERITLLASTSSKLINEKIKFGAPLIKKSKTYTSLLPFGRGVGDGLSDTL
jgi:hypothetical protein